MSEQQAESASNASNAASPESTNQAPSESQPHNQLLLQSLQLQLQLPQTQPQHPYSQAHSGKPYNKHHGLSGVPGTSEGSAQNRHSYQGGANNKHHNKRNYIQKAGHPKQYPQGYAYAPAYGGNYFYSYPYSQGMMPVMGQMPGYIPQLPSQAHASMQQPYQPGPTGGKIKITDKEGRQIDLEEKTKSSASSSVSSTPKLARAQIVGGTSEGVTSPAPGTASLVDANASASPKVANASPAEAPAAAAAALRLSAAEEFRKKILEKAKLAQQKKDEEKAKLDAEEKSGKESEERAKQEADAEAEAKAAALAAEKVAAEQAAAEKAAAEKAAADRAAAEKAAAEKAAAEAAAASTESKEEVTKEKGADEVQQVSDEASPKVSEPKEASAEPQEEHEPSLESEERTIEENEEGAESANSNVDEEDTEQVAVFDLTQYFSRLETVKFIEDPFSFSYPYPLTGVDSRWKAGAKKYRYDPQFLLQFRDFVQYPVDDAWKDKLESLGISALKKSPSGPQRMNSNSKFGNQMQGGRFNGAMQNRLGSFDGRQNSRSGSKRRGQSNTGSSRDKSVRNRNQSKRGRESREKDEEPPKPAVEVAPLVPSANRWVPRSRQKTEEVKLAPDGSVMLGTEDIERKVKSALNKLTLEMFEPITEELMTIAKQSMWEENAQTVRQVISLTFAKACDEPFWSSVYAQFCAKLLKEIPDEVKDVNIPSKTGEPATGGDMARRILLATCQSEYEKGWVDKLPTNPDGSPLEPEMMSDEYYAMAAAKRRGLGLVKFIGNLYILNMLNDQVILHCLRDQSKNVVDPSEDSLENLAQLIKTVGPRFEALDRNRAALTLVYDNIQQILDNCKLSSRIKFMLMDLQDLRKSNWKSAKQDAGPKTIKEIHNEAELKRIEESRAQAEKRRQNKGGYASGGYGGGNDSRSNSTRNNSSWGSKKESRFPTKDARGFTSVSRSQSNRPSPESNTSFSAPRENSKRTDSVASNIFAALGGEGDDDDDAEPAAN